MHINSKHSHPHRPDTAPVAGVKARFPETPITIDPPTWELHKSSRRKELGSSQALLSFEGYTLAEGEERGLMFKVVTYHTKRGD